MKKSLLIFFLIFVKINFAQISSTTAEGKKIILYPNGYWEYADHSTKHAQYFPKISKNDVIIKHSYYTLSYDTIHHLAKWTIYQLTKNMLENKTAERKNKFTPDPDLPYSTQFDADYKNSGFDKGHLVPAADMSFSETAMQESFYYTNVSPQKPSFNRGIWKKLEEQVREWAKQYENIIVISGTVISDSLSKMGIHKITIPHNFFKIIACIKCKEINAIGFIIPNEKSELPIQHFAVRIDSIESITHIDFFSALENDIESKLEKNSSLNFWFK